MQSTASVSYTHLDVYKRQPEYRLPKAVLDEEIATIESMGVEIITNTKVGVDIPFETIRSDYDAVLLGIGAWVSTGVGCKGEDAEGVIGGIDFLRRVVRNEEIGMGRKVAIVGGGNTAMDACRTAVRLGAEAVSYTHLLDTVILTCGDGIALSRYKK